MIIVINASNVSNVSNNTFKIGEAWQYQLSGNIKTYKNINIPIWDVDIDSLEDYEVTRLLSSGKKLICYINVGSLENDRGDHFLFPKNTIGNIYPGWSDERFVDIRNNKVRRIMVKRIKESYKRGCSAIEPDNIDSYTYNTGFKLTQKDEIEYIKFLSYKVHSLNMSFALKNNGDILPKIIDLFDFAIVESCVNYNECNLFTSFIKRNKPVFAVEYTTPGEEGGCDYHSTQKQLNDACKILNKLKFEGIIKTCDLDSEWRACQKYDKNGIRNTTI